MRRLFSFRPLTLAVASLVLGLIALVPTTGVSAQYFGYPPNAVVSTYFDPRYCGNGAVSVVTDQGGALIDVCTSTGQRILPVYPDYGYPGYGYGYGYTTPAYNYNYGYNYGYTAPTYNYGYNYGYATTYGYNGGYYGGQYTYNDSRTNCPNGRVTATPSGYFCTANGAVAFVP